MSTRDSRTKIKRSKRSAARLGPLYIDPKIIEPGLVYKWVSGNVPGVLEYYQRLGYVVVKSDTKAGDAQTSTSSAHGSSVTVQSKCGQELVLMKITQELEDELNKEFNEEQSELMDSLSQPAGIDPSALTGEIKISR